MHAVLHNIGVFFGHLASVSWPALGLALLCQAVKLCCVGRGVRADEQLPLERGSTRLRVRVWHSRAQRLPPGPPSESMNGYR